MAQIFTKEGVPLVQIENISKFDHVSLTEVRDVFNALVKRLANLEDQNSTSALLESDHRVFIIKFIDGDLAIFFGFRQDRLREKNEPVPSLYNKVLTFSSQVKSITES
jgi:hypothetical protein